MIELFCMTEPSWLHNTRLVEKYNVCGPLYGYGYVSSTVLMEGWNRTMMIGWYTMCITHGGLMLFPRNFVKTPEYDDDIFLLLCQFIEWSFKGWGWKWGWWWESSFPPQDSPSQCLVSTSLQSTAFDHLISSTYRPSIKGEQGKTWSWTGPQVQGKWMLERHPALKQHQQCTRCRGRGKTNFLPITNQFC